MIQHISSKIFFGGVVVASFIFLMSTVVAQNEGVQYPPRPETQSGSIPYYNNNRGPGVDIFPRPDGYYYPDGQRPYTPPRDGGVGYPSQPVGGRVSDGMDMMRAMEDRLMLRIENLLKTLIASMMVGRTTDGSSHEDASPSLPVADPIKDFLSSLTDSDLKSRGGKMACPIWVQKVTGIVFHPQASQRSDYCIGSYMMSGREEVFLCAEMKDSFHLDAKNYSSKTCPAFVTQPSLPAKPAIQGLPSNNLVHPLSSGGGGSNYPGDQNSCPCWSGFCTGPFNSSGIDICVGPENSYDSNPEMVCAKKDGSHLVRSNYSRILCPANIKETMRAMYTPSGPYVSGNNSTGGSNYGECGGASSVEECGRRGSNCRWRGDTTNSYCYYESGTGSGMNSYSPPGAYAYPSGNNNYTSSMKNCWYDHASRNGVSVNSRIWCERDYYNCHVGGPSGAVVTMEYLALGGPTSCEEGWNTPTNSSVSQESSSDSLLASLLHTVLDPLLSLFGL